MNIDVHGLVNLSVEDVLGHMIAVLGMTGSGKSNTVAVLVEELLAANVPVVIVDTAGEYYGLKRDFDILEIGKGRNPDRPVDANVMCWRANVTKETIMKFGIDLGMGANKLYGPAGGLQIPSHVATDNGQVVARLAGMKATKPPLKVTASDGRTFFVGAGAHDWGRPVENLDYDRLTGAPEMAAVFYGAFTRYMQAHSSIASPVTLYVGMPLEPLSGPEDQVKATLSAVRGWMRGEHHWQADGESYHLLVDDVKITSQPSGALFDYVLDDKGKFITSRKSHLKQEIGVISVGFNTVELLAIQNLTPVQRFTAGTTSGVRRLLELVNGDGLYSLGELDTQLRSGSLDVREVLPVWGREVTGHVERVWGKSWRRFAQIVMVGGGAILLNGQLSTRFNGKSYLPDDPVLSIARGLYKLALMQTGSK